MDEHRIGLKPIVRGVWAPVGERPIAPGHHRFEWLLRLMRDAKLRPLLSHPLCEPQVLHPPTERVEHLAQRLLAQKRKAAWTRSESSTRVSQLAWQDATVVAQTTMLNELARQRQTRKFGLS
jgi:hypothetical protein